MSRVILPRPFKFARLSNQGGMEATSVEDEMNVLIAVSVSVLAVVVKVVLNRSV